MTIHFFTKGDAQLGDSRQRAYRIAEELSTYGFTTILHRPTIKELTNAGWLQKVSLLTALIGALTSVKKEDIIFLQRTVGNKYFFVLMVGYLTLFRRKMIFDFDDAIYLHDSFKTKFFVRMADAVIVCSQVLADWVRPQNPNVTVFHTALKYADYAAFTKEYALEPAPLVIGWVGTAKDHYANLEFLARVFRRLLSKTPVPFTFTLIGAVNHAKTHELFETLPGLKANLIDTLDWSNPESVPREIQKFDVGVMPLVLDDEWNLARSSFKTLEYMACGVASLSSRVGEIVNVVRDGNTGMLAGTEDEWIEKLVTLLEDRALRMRIGAAGQKWVRENESYEAIIPRMVELTQSVSSRSR
jgi:glycosyltransferase involved in cell wall biosynthesis